MFTNKLRWGLVVLGLVVGGTAVCAAAGMNQEQREQQAYASTHDGDLVRGQALFDELSCSSCHGAAGKGTRRGPLLVGMGASHGKDEIIRSILEPSQRIPQGWQRVTINTSEGRTITGRLQSAPDAAVLEVLTSSGQLVRVPRERAEEVTLNPRSPMPEGLADGLSPQDFAALVSYVNSLR
jgi:putative heme-binding domain-containing protein